MIEQMARRTIKITLTDSGKSKRVRSFYRKALGSIPKELGRVRRDIARDVQREAKSI